MGRIPPPPVPRYNSNYVAVIQFWIKKDNQVSDTWYIPRDWLDADDYVISLLCCLRYPWLLKNDWYLQTGTEAVTKKRVPWGTV